GCSGERSAGRSDLPNPSAFTPDGKRLVTVGADRNFGMWNLITGKEQVVQRAERRSSKAVAFSPGSKAVAFSPDGKMLATGGRSFIGRWNRVAVTDVITGKEVFEVEGRERDVINCVTFSPGGTRLAYASVGQDVPLGMDVFGKSLGEIKVLDSKNGQELLTLKGHNGVAFSPDGQRLASGSEDYTVTVWDTFSGMELLRLKGHTDYVTCVAFSPDGQRLASGSEDYTVKIWDASLIGR
ncbi:MAG: hypothetical protein O3B86_20315, partial [Planctomycetota bacterium]|nr:hypothetical protein [Planctomycetota bacterium]